MRSRVLNGYWAFQAPLGYTYQRVTGRGMMLKRDEPIASILAEGLEGYASGRFETQADVMRFFLADPLFPKKRTGRVHPQRVANVLQQCCYAGYVEAPNWEVARRPGQHEALISYETCGRIQDRLAGVNRLPKQQNLKVDFPLRGFVLCDDCETPLMACWSTGNTARHSYYLCPRRGCASYGKSTRRDTIEGEFATLLQSVRPTEGLFRVARTMFQELWTHRLEQADSATPTESAQTQDVNCR